jgi:hypothetical protein
MAVYKVIQDVEAEDKLLGPLTLKGFIYALVAGALLFIEVRLAMAGTLGVARWPIMFVLFFPMLLFGVLASPLGKEQPTEVWLLSHVMFFIKSKKRIWDQSGQTDLVTITAPKKMELNLTKGFSQVEVKSRLQALANTLDSHGWVVKNVNINLDTHPTYFQKTANESDRLVSPTVIAEPGAVVDIHAKDDILDETNNPRAQQVEQLMEKAEDERRQSIQKTIEEARQQGSSSHLKEQYKIDEETPKPVVDKETGVKLEEIGDRKLRNKHPHFRTKPSLAEERRQYLKNRKHHKNRDKGAMTATHQADKMELAKSGNALSVASVAELANRHDRKPEDDGVEVMIEH